MSVCARVCTVVTKKCISGTLPFRRLQCKARTRQRYGFINLNMIMTSVSAVFLVSFLLSYLYLPHISCSLKIRESFTQVFNIKSGF